MKIKEFINEFKTKNIRNTPIAPDAVGDYIRGNVKIAKYIPFRMKREIAELVVSQNIKEVDGIKKYDDINAYISFITASVTAHTDLEFGEDPIEDYDLLAETGLLTLIIDMFKEDHTECDVILKMALAAELEENNINILIGKFLNGILTQFDGVGEILKDKLGNFDIAGLLGDDFNQDNLNKLSEFLNTYNK